jgi:hypothetical protein
MQAAFTLGLLHWPSLITSTGYPVNLKILHNGWAALPSYWQDCAADMLNWEGFETL